MRTYKCKWKLMGEKLLEFTNRVMILSKPLRLLETLWGLTIKYKWKHTSSCCPNSRMNRVWSTKTCLFTLTILSIEVKWKRLMRQIGWNYILILRQMDLGRKAHCRIVWVQSVTAWRTSRWEMEVTKTFQMIPVWNSKNQGNLRNLCKL